MYRRFNSNTAAVVHSEPQKRGRRQNVIGSTIKLPDFADYIAAQCYPCGFYSRRYTQLNAASALRILTVGRVVSNKCYTHYSAVRGIVRHVVCHAVRLTKRPHRRRTWTVNRIRQVAPMCTQSNMLCWAHASPYPERHLDRGSAFFAGLTIVKDRQTDRPRYVVGNNTPRLRRPT